MDLLTGVNTAADTAMIKARLSLTHYALGSQCFNQKDYEGANIEFTRVSSYTLSNIFLGNRISTGWKRRVFR